MGIDDGLSGLFQTEARKFAEILAEGAVHAAVTGEVLEVRLVKLPRAIRSWAGKQTTLMNHITSGAYAVVKQTDGSRWLYTTTQGTAQVATLQRWTREPITLISGSGYNELRSRLETLLGEAMRHATRDGRSRRATARGFDYEAAHERRQQLNRFEEVADGTARLDEAELEAFLRWWDTQIDPRIKRMIGGLPVDTEIYRLAERAGLRDSWNLITDGQPTPRPTLHECP